MTGVYCWARLEALLSRLRTAHRAMRPPGGDPPYRPAIPTSEWDLQHLPVPGTSRPLRADSRGWPPIPLGFGRSSRLVPEPTPPQEARSRAKGGVSAAEGWATPARPFRVPAARLARRSRAGDSRRGLVAPRDVRRRCPLGGTPSPRLLCAVSGRSRANTSRWAGPVKPGPNCKRGAAPGGSARPPGSPLATSPGDPRRCPRPSWNSRRCWSLISDSGGSR
jgi:hypothetical protein